MPLILNIETATEVCSVALASEGKLISIRESHSGFAHSENITVFIDEVIKEAGTSLNALDAISVSKGPGSYTGLRIGVSTAKGLCFALDKPLIAVPTLQALTLGLINKFSIFNFQFSIIFCPILDARRMEVYCAVYDSELNEVEATSAKIIEESSFRNLLDSNTIYFFGSGAAKCKSIINHPNTIFIEDVFASASSMISLSEKLFNEKKFEDAAYFEPFYLKDFVAGASAKL
ncbi:MAG TPA: tRNA (adenosine(37)-N6)-threonylcarbamoyltransferase complex dimerization subunit type 1 TsaB [Bacteroidia bacterium]|nr:tRNA (adenosine(37)-N6)-threonylcarbamoyltransferase complex dimerization subunit type 1 TsaB [Bacteroidia bacterium]